MTAPEPTAGTPSGSGPMAAAPDPAAPAVPAQPAGAPPATDPGPAGTGHPAVDAALRALADAAAEPPEGQVAAFQAAHRTLRETLATIDDA